MSTATPTSIAQTPPGPRGYPILGILPRIWRNPLRFFEEVAEECGPVARMGVGKFTLYLISGPDEIQHILHDNWRNYWKGDGLDAAKIVMGEGLATSTGKLWQRQRRLIQPGFSSKQVATQLPCVLRRTSALLDAWSAYAESGKAFDLAPEMQHLTLRIICEGMFGADVTHEQEDAISQATLVACAYIDYAAWSFIKVPRSVPTPRNVRFKRALRLLDDTVYGIVNARRASGAETTDMLGRLLSARDPDTGEAMSDRQLRDEVMTLFVAGHETPANCLAWTLHLLTQHPTIAEQVRVELAEVLGGREPTPEDLPKLELLERVFKESLRIYPPGWVIVRTPYEDDVLGGFAVPRGAPLLISQYVVHRSPKYWERPEVFDPDRWLPERVASRPRYSYFPFGGGIRVCLGNTFAMLMMKSILAGVLQRYDVRAVSGHEVVPQPSVTLRPRHGVRVTLEKR